MKKSRLYSYINLDFLQFLFHFIKFLFSFFSSFFNRSHGRFVLDFLFKKPVPEQHQEKEHQPMSWRWLACKRLHQGLGQGGQVCIKISSSPTMKPRPDDVNVLFVKFIFCVINLV